MVNRYPWYGCRDFGHRCEQRNRFRKLAQAIKNDQVPQKTVDETYLEIGCRQEKRYYDRTGLQLSEDGKIRSVYDPSVWVWETYRQQQISFLLSWDLCLQLPSERKRHIKNMTDCSKNGWESTFGRAKSGYPQAANLLWRTRLLRLTGFGMCVIKEVLMFILLIVIIVDDMIDLWDIDIWKYGYWLLIFGDI